MSKTAGDRDSFPKDHQWEMTYGVSNGHVTVRSAILATACLLVSSNCGQKMYHITLAGAHTSEISVSETITETEITDPTLTETETETMVFVETEIIYKRK